MGELTGESSGGGAGSPVDGGAVRPTSAPVTACGGGGGVLLGAHGACLEKRAREREGNGTVGRTRIPGAYL